MTITVGGNTLLLQYPLEAQENFMENYFSMFDGQATNVGATLTIPTGKIFGTYAWNALAGSVATLPAASGSLMRVHIYVSVLATSNSHILYCNKANGGGGADVFVGLIMGSRTDSGNAVLGFAAASTSNTITLNRSTTGSVNLGEYVEVTDVASGVWAVRGFLSATGAAFATPFSHT